MSDSLIDIHTWPIPETVFLKEEQEIASNPIYGFFEYQKLRESTQKYVTVKELRKFKESLPDNMVKEEIDVDILNKNLAEKLFILDFIKEWYIFPEKLSQDLYFWFNLETGGITHLDQENGPRLKFLIWWDYHFGRQVIALRKQGVNMWYIKVTIKKHPTDNEFYIESIDAVAEKDS